jgi:hypothetical protein
LQEARRKAVDRWHYIRAFVYMPKVNALSDDERVAWEKEDAEYVAPSSLALLLLLLLLLNLLLSIMRLTVLLLIIIIISSSPTPSHTRTHTHTHTHTHVSLCSAKVLGLVQTKA